VLTFAVRDHPAKRNAALLGVRFGVVLKACELDRVAPDSDHVPYGVKVRADRYGRKQIGAELSGFRFREPFENTIGQMGQPFRPAEFHRKRGMAIAVERATDETGAPVALGDFIGGAVCGETRDEFLFDGGVVVVGEHF
jgi:hypothetical protein